MKQINGPNSIKIDQTDVIKQKKEQKYLKKRQEYLSSTNQIFGKNILQILTIGWLTPLFSLGYQRPIDEQLIPTLKQKHKSDYEFQKFRDIFQEYHKKINQGHNKNKYQKILLKSFFYLYRQQFIIFIILCCLLVAGQVYNSIFGYELIDYISSGERTQVQNVKYFIIFFFLNLEIVFLHNYLEYGCLLKGLSFMNVLNLMLYNKVLKYPLISDKQFQVSEILNYSQVDVQRFELLGYYIKETSRSVLLFLVGIVLLFVFLQISFLIGISALIFFTIVSYGLLRVIANTNDQYLQCSDQRIKVAEQILQIIKYIKVNVLQEYFLGKIMEKRETQLKKRKKMNISTSLNKAAYFLSPSFVIFLTLFSYISIFGSITTGKAFFLIIIFKSIQFSLQRMPQCLNQVIFYWFSFKRIETFLLATQMKKNMISPLENQEEDAIVISNGNFLWQKDKDEEEKEKNQNKKQTQTIQSSGNLVSKSISLRQIGNEKETQFPEVQFSKKKYFRVLRGIQIKFKKRQMTMIIGDIGSGKSSILHAILNEMVKQPNSLSNIQIHGSIAYCSQKPWIISSTIKENILFYHPYDEQKFKNAIHYACLEQDIKMIPNGVQSMIGEKGINLSGGQKARISLARSIYANKDIYLLDDVLSAVDVHVARFLMEKTLKQYLKDKTIIMPTHAAKFLTKADNIIVMKKGRIDACGTYQQIRDHEYFIKVSRQSSQAQRADQNRNYKQTVNQQHMKFVQMCKNYFLHKISQRENPQTQINNNNNVSTDLVEQIIIQEEKQSGGISSLIYLEYIKLNGGKVFVLVIIFLMSGWGSFILISNLQFQKWINDESKQKQFLYFYLGYSVISTIFIAINFLYLSFCQIKVGSIFFRAVVKAIMYADLNQFFNRVPIGRILNRLSKDVTELDEITTNIFSNVLLCIFSVTTTLIMSVIVSTPFALIPIGLVAGLWAYFINYYIRSQQQLVRIVKISTSPVVSGLSELTSGLQTIRAYGVEKQFGDKFMQDVNHNRRMNFTRQSIQYWFYIRISLISLIVNYSIFAYCIFTQIQDSSKVGLFLAFITTLFEEIQNFLYWFVVFRLKMISIQRLSTLTNLQPEIGYRNRVINKNIIPDQSLLGKIQFRNYSTKYRKGLPLVLRNISFTIQPSKKVGIIGRTGAGKSTLINCLLRLLEPVSGQLLINGGQIRKWDIKQLRDSITMIEQDPTLMNATFRQNLDPANKYSDEEIIFVLKQCNLMGMIKNKGGLNSPVTNNTISAGQKQLLCICRAILKKSCIVLIDEATANIDVNNDRLIQQIIKKGFKNSTVLTIAHRLSTLEQSDQILVLNQGEIVEWGDAKQLKSNPKSIYYKMCCQNDRSYLC